MKRRHVEGAAAVALVAFSACAKEGASAQSTGYPSPPLPELVEAAVAQGPPRHHDPGYTPPARIDVPNLKPPPGWLDMKIQEQILERRFGVPLNTKERERDAITAMSACGKRVAGCVQRKDLPGGRSIDACWMHTPRCQTDHPWDEPNACCPARCSELYEALRQRGYPDAEASLRTLQSECFNGMRELMASTK